MPLRSEMDLVARSALHEQQSSRIGLVDEAVGHVPDLRNRSGTRPLRVGDLSVGELEVAARSVRFDSQRRHAHDVAVPQRGFAPDARSTSAPLRDIGPR